MEELNSDADAAAAAPEPEPEEPPPPPPPRPAGPRRAACKVSSTSPAANTAEETRIVRGRPMEAQSARAPPTSGEMYWRPWMMMTRGRERERKR